MPMMSSFLAPAPSPRNVTFSLGTPLQFSIPKNALPHGAQRFSPGETTDFIQTS